jgi:hypothetical protein
VYSDLGKIPLVFKTKGHHSNIPSKSQWMANPVAVLKRLIPRTFLHVPQLTENAENAVSRLSSPCRLGEKVASSCITFWDLRRWTLDREPGWWTVDAPSNVQVFRILEYSGKLSVFLLSSKTLHVQACM